jgi:hypothetical protein
MTVRWIRILAVAAAATVVFGAGTGAASASVAGNNVQARTLDRPFSSSALGQDPAKCQIHYDAKEPHLRESHNHKAVGVKPYVTCKRSVQLIVLHVQMYKYHFDGLLTEKVGPEFTQESKHNVARFQQLNVAVACTSKASTKWFAITWGKVLEGGKWYYSPNPPGLRSENRVLPCGT